jgi:hypothetical protein
MTRAITLLAASIMAAVSFTASASPGSDAASSAQQTIVQSTRDEAWRRAQARCMDDPASCSRPQATCENDPTSCREDEPRRERSLRQLDK